MFSLAYNLLKKDAYSNDFKRTVLSWSVLLKYQLEHRYDVSNWSSFLRTSEILQKRLK